MDQRKPARPASTAVIKRLLSPAVPVLQSYPELQTIRADSRWDTLRLDCVFFCPVHQTQVSRCFLNFPPPPQTVLRVRYPETVTGPTAA